ncbi:DegT/DnrJ/EryC1/StrS family aminotransferase [candidate division KSB1 bacterium]|nr:DegT/DnrJ/EryC1/StrS family aminotransferase [candidate division KSB1 bacterium]RQW01082.1 MAG: DegT/DnrJ/EryC1/StrS family aminotransferase [candidate division KSB1 bacterium]
MTKIPLSHPYLTSSEKRLVLQVLNGAQLSLGPRLDEFEHRLADYVGATYAVAVNSGTSALHLCIKSLNIREGDEVITTPFSFIASANCILYEKARPVFVDIDPLTFNIDPGKIEENINSKTRAILPVHVFGLPCDMTRMKAIAQQHNLYIIEDACEALGAKCLLRDPAKMPPLHYHKVGAIGDCGAFGFYPNKQMTTGEGGLVVTNNVHIATSCRSLRNQGRSENPAWLEHTQLGYNYRLSDINCAIGIAQLQKLHTILRLRERVAHWYNERLHRLEEIVTPFQSITCRRSWFVYVCRLSDDFSKNDRNSILDQLRASGIECRDYFPPIHLQPFYARMFGYKKGDFPVAEHVAERTIALPFFTNMSEEQVDYVCKRLCRIVQKLKSEKSVPSKDRRNGQKLCRPSCIEYDWQRDR